MDVAEEPHALAAGATRGVGVKAGMLATLRFKAFTRRTARTLFSLADLHVRHTEDRIILTVTSRDKAGEYYLEISHDDWSRLAEDTRSGRRPDFTIIDDPVLESAADNAPHEKIRKWRAKVIKFQRSKNK